MLDPGYIQGDMLRAEGFASVGQGVSIAANCWVVGPENIRIGDNVRIDGFCTIVASDGEISLGSNIHIGSYCHLSGGNGIVMRDFSGLSQGTKVFSRTDDFSGEYLTGPTVPEMYTGGKRGLVTVGRHVVIGAGSVILPGVTVGEGTTVGALSLVTRDLDEWSVYAGIPAARVGNRSKALLTLEQQFVSDRDTP